MPVKAKDRQQPTYTKYIDSPLGQLLDAILKKMQEQKNKYPLRADSPVELKYSHKILNAAQDVLSRVHNAIWSNFCSGGHPGATTIFWLIKDAWSLSKYKDIFESRENVFYGELEKHLNETVKTAISMEGDVGANVVEILRQNKENYFASMLEIPGVDIENYFFHVKDRVNVEIGRLKKDLSNLDSIISEILFWVKNNTYAIDKDSGLSTDIDKLDLSPYLMFYELIEIVLMHYNTLPRELSQLIPFYDPKSLNLDLHSGYVIGPGLRKLIGKSFKFVHAPKKESQVSYKFFIYEPKAVPVNQGGNAQVEASSEVIKDEDLYYIDDKEFEIDPHYKEHFDKALVGFLGVMVLYYQKTVLNQNVQKMLDKNEFMQRLLKECTRQIQSALPEVQIDGQCLTKVKQLEGLDQVLEANRMLSDLNRFKKAFDELKATRDLPAQLINNVYHAVTKETKKENELIPSQLLKRIEGIKTLYIIPLVDCGLNEIEKKLKDNQDKYDSYECLISQCTKTLNSAVDSFSQKKIAELEKFLENSSLAFAGLSKTLAEVNQDIKFECPALSNEFNSLECDLEAVTREQQIVLGLQKSVSDLLRCVKNVSEVEPEFKQFDKDGQLQKHLTEKATDCITETQRLKAEVDEKVSKINEKKKVIEKAHAEAKFLEEMKKANPEQMKKLIIERQEKISQQSHRIEELTAQHADAQKYNALLREVAKLLSKHKEFPDSVVCEFENNKPAGIEWIEECVVFLDASFKQITDQKKFPDDYKDLLNKLGFVQRCLKFRAGVIPFKEIDDLPCFKSETDAQPCGFEKCLEIVSMSDGTREKIRDFRHRQDSFYTFNPSDKETTETRSFLFNVICTKIDQIEKLIKQGVDISQALPRLVEIKNQITAIDLKDSEKSLHDLILEVSTEKARLEDSIPIIHEFINVQIALKKHVDLLEAFNGEEDFLNNWTLYNKPDLLYMKQADLEVMAKNLKIKIEQSKFPENNEQYFTAISKFLTTTRNRINQMIQFKFESTQQKFNQALIDFDGKFNTIHGGLAELLKPISLDDADDDQVSYEKTLLHYSDVNRNQKINQLLEDNFSLSRAIFTTLSELETIKDSTMKLKDKHQAKNQEESQRAVDYTAQIEDKSRVLRELQEKVVSNGKSLALLKRMSLSAELFKNFDQYLKERAERYYVKDAFYDDDCIARTIYVNELREKLNEFNAAGDIFVVIDHINNNKDQFPGVHFSSVLSRITCDLIDYDNQWDKDGNKKALPLVQVNTILKSLKDSKKMADKVLANKINYLYGRIQDMHDYSKTLGDEYSHEVRGLADKLKASVDQFVQASAEKETDKEKLYKDFNLRLTAILHSKDDLLTNLGYDFGRLVLNIAVALISLCLQPICYKIARGSFGFFAKNFVQESLDRVTRSLDELKPLSVSVSA